MLRYFCPTTYGFVIWTFYRIIDFLFQIVSLASIHLKLDKMEGILKIY